MSAMRHFAHDCPGKRTGVSDVLAGQVDYAVDAVGRVTGVTRRSVPQGGSRGDGSATPGMSTSRSEKMRGTYELMGNFLRLK